ncbi:CXXX repeat peptide modification system protein [Tissierella carlieri]|uniref:CXXX repeat peptide modification system protein n=1 Tax=Tissierella carlieri TaxID=689904 RepID=UPI001C101D2B|nr:CXXX repeat peptide modification system protein [Tissierella carlieri]MBU5310457.1 CXXX repeat peptide modification system protein [Tissierella carlieri]
MSNTEASISMQEIHTFEDFYEKRAALNNLILVCENNELIRNEDLYQRFIKDYTQLEHDYQNYWAEIAEKYDIQEKEGYYFHLDFKTGKVTLRAE